METYYNTKSPGGYGGVSRLAAAIGVKNKKAEEWLRGQRTYTLHKPARTKYDTRKYKTSGIDFHWQADLCEVGSINTHNDGINYILTVIDVFSRYAWAEPVKNKTGALVTKAFEKIFELGRKPIMLQTDQGKEFENATFQSFLKRHGVRFFTIKSQFKAALAERFNRTLKSKIYRYFTHTGTQRWIEVLPDFLESYNNSVHRSIGMIPSNVNRETEMDLWEKQEDEGAQKVTSRNPSFKFRLGQHVRLSKTKQVFDKGYLPNYTEEIFSISKILNTDPPQYKVADYNGDVIEGSFYAAELQLVDKPDTYAIEEILSERTVNGIKQYYVKWLGYPPSFNSWTSTLVNINNM
jgi:transposase InsO family protein